MQTHSMTYTCRSLAIVRTGCRNSAMLTSKGKDSWSSSRSIDLYRVTDYYSPFVAMTRPAEKVPHETITQREGMYILSSPAYVTSPRPSSFQSHSVRLHCVSTPILIPSPPSLAYNNPTTINPAPTRPPATKGPAVATGAALPEPVSSACAAAEVVNVVGATEDMMVPRFSFSRSVLNKFTAPPNAVPTMLPPSLVRSCWAGVVSS